MADRGLCDGLAVLAVRYVGRLVESVRRAVELESGGRGTR
jgi:hypothetical protein